MKSMIKKLCLFAGVLMASAQMSHAAGIAVSSTVFVPTMNSAAGYGVPFLIRRNESLQYVVSSTNPVITATVTFQYSSNAQNWVTEKTTALAAGVVSISDVFPVKTGDTYYRFIVSGSSNGPVTVLMKDFDDDVYATKNNKQEDIVTLKDDSFKINGFMSADRLRLNISSASAGVAISSNTTLAQYAWYQPIVAGVQGSQAYPLGGVGVTTTTALADKTVVLLISTGAGGAFTSVATPAISTITAQNGDVIILQGLQANTTFTFQDNRTLPGTALSLNNGANGATALIGPGDVLGLMFFNGIWREMFYTNNE